MEAEPVVGDLMLLIADSGTVQAVEGLLLFDDTEYDADRRKFDVWREVHTHGCQTQ